MRRASTMAFAPRMHVFPGGRVDDADYAERLHFVSGDPAALAQRASTDVAGVSALYSCAVRETAEEVGLDLAVRDREGRVLIDASQVPIIDHWVTPEGESRRYDVRFFATVVDGDTVRLTTTEADSAAWMRPSLALEEFSAGRLAMLPPTEAVLRRLASFDAAADAIEDGRARPVVPLLPRRIASSDGTARWVLVHDRTGEVLADPISVPHTRETDGMPRTAT